MRKRICLLCLLSLGFVGITAQAEAQNSAFTPSDKTDGKHWIGLHTGMVTGLGFSYRYFPGRLGLQLTALPLYGNKQFNYNGAATLHYNLRSAEYGRLLVYASFGSGNFTANRNEVRLHSGLGLGFELFPTKDIAMSVLIGYGGMNVNDERDMILLPTIGAGLYYRIF